MHDHLFSALSNHPQLLLSCVSDRPRPLPTWIWLTPIATSVGLALAAWLAG